MLIKENLEFSVLGEPSSSKVCLIFIHGWKGNKSSFKKMVEHFNIKDSVWYLPQAPYLIEGEKDSYSWTYEISPGKFERKEPLKLLVKFFSQEILSRFDSRDVYIFGFSQGGLVCYEITKILSSPLGGVFPIGGFMAEKDKEIRRIHPSQINTPIMIGHGESDEVISKEESEIAHRLLSVESDCVSLDIYKGGHKIGISYIRKAKELIEKNYQ